MPQELTTQVQLDAFAAEVARELGTHCRTAELTDFGRGLGRLIIDGDGHALRLCQPDDRHPGRLRIYAALPDENKTPSIGVTASTARHVAREIARRLYPLHAEVAQQAARQQAEEIGRRAVAEALAERTARCPDRGAVPAHPDHLAARHPAARAARPCPGRSIRPPQPCDLYARRIRPGVTGVKREGPGWVPTPPKDTIIYE